MSLHKKLSKKDYPNRIIMQIVAFRVKYNHCPLTQNTPLKPMCHVQNEVGKESGRLGRLRSFREKEPL
jgi:hypothetical protein